jgi:hypothetical protein
MDRDKMTTLYRGLSIDASTKLQFIWESGVRGEDFLESSNPLTNLATTDHFFF